MKTKSHWKMILIYILLVISLLILLSSILYNWSKNPLKSFFYAVITAIIIGFGLIYLQRRLESKPKMEEDTVLIKPQNLLAKLVLDNKNEVVIKNYEHVLGREDFLGLVSSEKLLFIGKTHFRLTKFDDGVYIEDLHTKNGTMINGRNIKGLGKIKLGDGDEICVAKVLNLHYLEENSLT
ncbi:FHA domain-containing protein [Methanobacterium aggregans]|uniref:FHA domain-containing protein n=1 Tax=Methanobacterium aggregans TaxID=1615586 RepID=UPI001AE4B6F2|nr:FHA domain-containing protein [Methanobacterium aggregans]MBP2046681.1 pSer/pThr/pTyr-binding forkhead associated (FHA) protein [Methanobacterium aggregans]